MDNISFTFTADNVAWQDLQPKVQDLAAKYSLQNLKIKTATQPDGRVQISLEAEGGADQLRTWGDQAKALIQDPASIGKPLLGKSGGRLAHVTTLNAKLVPRKDVMAAVKVVLIHAGMVLTAFGAMIILAFSGLWQAAGVLMLANIVGSKLPGRFKFTDDLLFVSTCTYLIASTDKGWIGWLMMSMYVGQWYADYLAYGNPFQQARAYWKGYASSQELYEAEAAQAPDCLPASLG